LTKQRPRTLLLSASDFNNDSRLQRIHGHIENIFSDVVTVAYGEDALDENMHLSPIPVRFLFARLLDVSKMLLSRALPKKYLLKMLAARHITKDLRNSSFRCDNENPFDFVIVKHWTSLPIAMLLNDNPKIWLDINEVFEAEHDNSKLWQLIYKPVIVRLLKLANPKIVLRSATSLEQIKYMQDDTILHLPNTKKPHVLNRTTSPQGEPIKLLYHGLVTTNRSLETAIRALEQCERSDLELTIRGNGKPHYLRTLQALVDDLNLTSRVHFEPSIENSKLIETASHYDIGLCLFANQSKQLVLAEPNKIYEYMAAGLAIIASETPTMKRMVEVQKIGEIIEISNNQINALSQILKDLDREQISVWQENSYAQALQTWSEGYDWPKLDSSLKQIQQTLEQGLNKT
jgi:glycosyltransferase involved in cell wall biosynthesis